MAVSSVCIINGCGNKSGDPNISLFKIGAEEAEEVFTLSERTNIGTLGDFISQQYKDYRICSAHYDLHQFTISRRLVKGAKPVRRLASQTPVMVSVPREVKGMLDSLLKTFTEYSSGTGETVINLLHQVNKQPSETQTDDLPDYQKDFVQCLQDKMSIQQLAVTLEQTSLQDEDSASVMNGREKLARDKLSKWFRPVVSTRRKEIEKTISEQVGNTMLGVYNGHENFQHVMEFVKETIAIAKDPTNTNTITLFICSPFYVSTEDDKYKKPEKSFMELMKLILGAQQTTTHLRVKFFTRSTHFSTAEKWTLDSNLQKQLSDAKEDGTIEVLYTKGKPFKHKETKRFFHCKWLARVEESNVQLLITTANVTDIHLRKEQDDTYQQLDSMERKNMDLAYFQVMFLLPILQVCEI